MEREPIIRSLKVQNVLSFGSEPTTIELKNLNVLIGPNGSGKSNLIEVIGLLQSAPKDLTTAISNGGGIDEWLWKGASKSPTASIEAIATALARPSGPACLRYKLSFTSERYRARITDEVVEDASKSGSSYFRYANGRPTLNSGNHRERTLQPEEFEPQSSILAQRKDPEHYPEITFLGNEFSRFALYRGWEFGALAAVREPCDVSLPSQFLSEDGDNLSAVLGNLLIVPSVKREIIESMKLFYDGAIDLRTSVQGGKIQTYLEENHLKAPIPLLRLSDGTVRWLSLLAILLNPDPPPLVCIEEPELGLHPDMVHELGKLLIHASARMQIVVTTHSDALVESFSEQPDSVLVCEKEAGATKMTRLSNESLSSWLKDYSLGQLWRKGEIGGNRW